MWVRRASAGRDLGKYQNSAEKNPVASNVHTKALELLNQLNSECALLTDNLPPGGELWSQGLQSIILSESSVLSVRHKHTYKECIKSETPRAESSRVSKRQADQTSCHSLFLVTSLPT